MGGTGTTGAHPYGTDSDYSAHYDGFMFYASTANPHHLAPNSVDVVGTDTATSGEFDTANHNYDVSWFNQLVSSIHDGTLSASHLPAVTYLKAPVYEDRPPGLPPTRSTSRSWLVNEVNSIETAAHLGQHRHLHHLRRLGRLVRPPVQRRHQPLRHHS